MDFSSQHSTMKHNVKVAHIITVRYQ